MWHCGHSSISPGCRLILGLALLMMAMLVKEGDRLVEEPDVRWVMGSLAGTRRGG